jgi:hypothetical protein
LCQLLADVVQERGRDAQRDRARRGRDRLVDRIVGVFDPGHDPAVLVVGRFQQLRLLGGTLQGGGPDQGYAAVDLGEGGVLGYLVGSS